MSERFGCSNLFSVKNSFCEALVRLNPINVKKNTKGLSFCLKSWFSNPYIFATRCRVPLIFQTLNSVFEISKIYTITLLGIRTFQFLAKTHFLTNFCDVPAKVEGVLQKVTIIWFKIYLNLKYEKISLQITVL